MYLRFALWLYAHTGISLPVFQSYSSYLIQTAQYAHATSYSLVMEKVLKQHIAALNRAQELSMAVKNWIKSKEGDTSNIDYLLLFYMETAVACHDYSVYATDLLTALDKSLTLRGIPLENPGD